MADNRKAIIHCCIEKSVYDMLTEHCARTGQTKTMAIRRAILAYCNAASKASEKAPEADAK